MGRSFESVRQGVKSIADRWARTTPANTKNINKYFSKCDERVAGIIGIGYSGWTHLQYLICNFP